MAGGGAKGGVTYGETDEIGWSVTKDPVDIADFHATILRLFGVDHLALTHVTWAWISASRHSLAKRESSTP